MTDPKAVREAAEELQRLASEFRRLELTPGNEPLRCSRMHFAMWASTIEHAAPPLTRDQVAAAVETLNGGDTWVVGFKERVIEHLCRELGVEDT